MVKIEINAAFGQPYLSVKLTQARRIKKRLPQPLPWIEGSLNGSYQEIAEALVFGLNHAVMTLSGGFSEHLFRLCLYEDHGGGEIDSKGVDRGIDRKFWGKLNRKTLVRLLDDCEGRKLLPKEDHKWWSDFRVKVRNVYVHFKVFDMLADAKEGAIGELRR